MKRQIRALQSSWRAIAIGLGAIVIVALSAVTAVVGSPFGALDWLNYSGMYSYQRSPTAVRTEKPPTTPRPPRETNTPRPERTRPVRETNTPRPASTRRATNTPQPTRTPRPIQTRERPATRTPEAARWPRWRRDLLR
jgi:hypothetical protein